MKPHHKQLNGRLVIAK